MKILSKSCFNGVVYNGIELDIRLPHSSSMVTSIGIKLLYEINSLEEVKEMIATADSKSIIKES